MWIYDKFWIRIRAWTESGSGRKKNIRIRNTCACYSDKKVRKPRFLSQSLSLSLSTSLFLSLSLHLSLSLYLYKLPRSCRKYILKVTHVCTVHVTATKKSSEALFSLSIHFSISLFLSLPLSLSFYLYINKLIAKVNILYVLHTAMSLYINK